VDQCGQTTFLVVPLSFAHRTLGALVVTSKSPVSLNKYLRKLAVELSFALAQILYTRLCIEQLRAGNEIINDVLPQPVAEHLRRRVISARSASMTLSVSGLDQMTQQQRPAHYWQQPATPQGEGLPGPRRSGSFVPDSPHQGLLSRLSEAASALRSQQQQLQQAGGSEQQQVQPRLPASEHGAFGVAYKSWHPHVTVLFADIAGYTAMSTDVEPEAVMLLLHELFSKYDHLCTQYGIYKVETIGDCYMACSGVLVDNPQHAQHMVQFGCAMLAVAASVQSPLGGSVRIRVGIHSGRVMSGIVGNIRARYCLFGDTGEIMTLSLRLCLVLSCQAGLRL
jgi:class 3 adenylate cyclase